MHDQDNQLHLHRQNYAQGTILYKKHNTTRYHQKLKCKIQINYISINKYIVKVQWNTV